MLFDYQDYVRNSSKYSRMLEAMKTEVLEFVDGFYDDPRFLSGWGHGYFCDEDGGRLIYDRSHPLEHRCSICGKVYTDYIYSTQFITMYRNEAVGTAVKAAVLYQVYQEQRYLDAVKKIIDFYAENYKYFALHAKEKINCDSTVDVGGAGRMMPQGLNEAIVAIRFVNAMELVKEKLEPEWLDKVRTLFFEPVYHLLLPQKQHIHNIPIWINSAFGIMGLFFQKPEWVAEATEHPFHIYEQLEHGLTADGFWYEGSIHYNFFALEGLMTFLVFAKTYDCPLSEKCLEDVKKMLFAAYQFAFDNDMFPNPSDGWPNICLKTYSYVYFMGYKVYGKEILPLLKHIASGALERGRLPLSEPYYFENRIPLAQMMFAADFKEQECKPLETRRSADFETFNCAMLRNDTFNVFMKYGHQTKSHAHPDKMNVEIMTGNRILTKDLSNSGYGTKICNNWHRTVAAHNTCVVNGQPTDVTRPGRLLAFSERLMEAEAECYDGILYDRRLELEENGQALCDTFTVTCREEGTIDWLFHLEDSLERETLTLRPEDGRIKEMYPELMEIYRIEDSEGSVALENTLVQMQIQLEEGAGIYLARSYNNPANRQRDTVIVRKKGKTARFVTRILAKN